MTLFGITHVSHLSVGPLLSVFLLFIPLSLGMAILRSHLWDIDIIINRTLVYGTLTVCVVALYVLVVVFLGTVLQAQGNFLLSLAATGLIAVLFQPLRLRLQRAINRLMFGERDMPYTVISRLGQRLEATLAPEAVLPTIVESVAHALKLPYTAVALRQQGELVIAASYGTAREGLTRLPLVYQTEQIGELLLAPRAAGESFTPADRSLLDDLARQTGVAAHAVRLTQELTCLTQDLQLARERLVSAREEERRRLRRDLHDGLGPQLSSQTLLLTSAQMVLRQDPMRPRPSSKALSRSRNRRLAISVAWSMRCALQLLMILAWSRPSRSSSRGIARAALSLHSKPRSSYLPCQQRSRSRAIVLCRRR